VQIAFAIFIVIWAVVMLEFWKRKEKLTVLEWGMIGYEDEEQNRPGSPPTHSKPLRSKPLSLTDYLLYLAAVEFKGELRKSVINGKEIMHFPAAKRKNLIIESSVIIGVLIAVVIGAVRHTLLLLALLPPLPPRQHAPCAVPLPSLTSPCHVQVVSIYVMRRALSKPLGSGAQTLASIINSVQIMIFNFIYSKVADILTTRENHRWCFLATESLHLICTSPRRTDTQFEDSMISKLFLFQVQHAHHPSTYPSSHSIDVFVLCVCSL
jgi:hypothetical protein